MPVRVAAAVGLALLSLLPWNIAWIATTAAIVLLGVPHGALDGEVARPFLQPRFGRSWFAVFAPSYLALSACVLACWQVAPLGTLAAFLAASAWHFGEEDAPEGDYLTKLVRGGLPIALPLLLHPVATCAVFGAAAQTPLSTPPDWLITASLAWLAVLSVWFAMQVAARDWLACLPVLGFALMFLALPPLSAFAIYFVCVHAPSHLAGLVRNPRLAPRVRSLTGAVRLSLPITTLTIAIGAALWPLYAGVPAVRFLGLTLQVLAALTLPHMLLGYAVAFSVGV